PAAARAPAPHRQRALTGPPRQKGPAGRRPQVPAEPVAPEPPAARRQAGAAGHASAPAPGRPRTSRPVPAPRAPPAPVEGDRRSHRRWGWPARAPGSSRSYGGSLRRGPRAPLPGGSDAHWTDMRSAEPSVRLLQLPVNDGGDPHAVANAQGDGTVTKISALQFIQARGKE